MSIFAADIEVIKWLKEHDKLFKKQAKALGDLSGQLTEMVGNQKIVKAFQYEERSVNKFNKINQKINLKIKKMELPHIELVF